MTGILGNFGRYFLLMRRVFSRAEKRKVYGPLITDEMVNTLSSDIAEALENEGTDIVDDYALSMNYGKEVELDSIDLNESKIKAAVRDAIEVYIDNNKADA